jgi:transcriptional regulator with XRE-family HTH domain
VAQTFGERLRALRVRNSLTPSALSQLVGVTEGAIRQMESGQTKSPSFVVGLRIARALSVDPWTLATGERAPSGSAARSEEAALLSAVEHLTTQVAAMDRRLRAVETPARAGTRRKVLK